MTPALQIGHVMAATDESDAGRQAVSTALGIASRVRARATIARVLPFDGNARRGGLEQLQRWVESDFPELEPRPATQYAIRLLLGDTADALARRSRVPCLFVPPWGAGFARMLVAMDGTPRGSAVLRFALTLAGELGAGLRLLTVERPWPGEPAELAVALPATRGEAVQAELDRSLAIEVEVRRGDVAEQILEAARGGREDMVVIGCHRGGPAGVIEAGSTTRHVIHQAPCAVLTVPL